MRTITSYIHIALVIAVAAIVAPGCDNLSPKSDSIVRNGAVQKVSGQVVFRDKDGGFYGILTDNGAQLEPVNLDAKYKTDGVHIVLQGQLDTTRLGTHSWGNPVEIYQASAE